MKRKLTLRSLSSAALVLGALLAFAPALLAQKTCYPSYITLSGTCPDSCGRGPDCPCQTCVEISQS